MSIDIKTAGIEPVRQTFDHLEARIGKGKPATRYQEAVHDFQMTENFHYRPTWDPAHELFDRRRTQIHLDDFDVLVDPRQYYYAPYTLQRAKQQEAADGHFTMLEKRGLFERLSTSVRAQIIEGIVPFRHYEWGANTNNCHMSAWAYGAPFNSAALMQAMDRLGLAQYLTRMALAIEPDPAVLDRAKACWMTQPAWQPLRRVVEDAMVTRDWFEVHVLQNLVLDGLLHPYAYTVVDERLAADGGLAYTLATEFMRDWMPEAQRWTDATIKAAITAHAPNQPLITQWIARWRPRALEALAPLAAAMLGDEATAVLQRLDDALGARLARLGLGA